MARLEPRPTHTLGRATLPMNLPALAPLERRPTGSPVVGRRSSGAILGGSSAQCTTLGGWCLQRSLPQKRLGWSLALPRFAKDWGDMLRVGCGLCRKMLRVELLQVVEYQRMLQCVGLKPLRLGRGPES